MTSRQDDRSEFGDKHHQNHSLQKLRRRVSTVVGFFLIMPLRTRQVQVRFLGAHLQQCSDVAGVYSRRVWRRRGRKKTRGEELRFQTHYCTRALLVHWKEVAHPVARVLGVAEWVSGATLMTMITVIKRTPVDDCGGGSAAAAVAGDCGNLILFFVLLFLDIHSLYRHVHSHRRRTLYGPWMTKCNNMRCKVSWDGNDEYMDSQCLSGRRSFSMTRKATSRAFIILLILFLIVRNWFIMKKEPIMY